MIFELNQALDMLNSLAAECGELCQQLEGDYLDIDAVEQYVDKSSRHAMLATQIVANLTVALRAAINDDDEAKARIQQAMLSGGVEEMLGEAVANWQEKKEHERH